MAAAWPFHAGIDGARVSAGSIGATVEVVVDVVVVDVVVVDVVVVDVVVVDVVVVDVGATTSPSAIPPHCSPLRPSAAPRRRTAEDSPAWTS